MHTFSVIFTKINHIFPAIKPAWGLNMLIIPQFTCSGPAARLITVSVERHETIHVRSTVTNLEVLHIKHKIKYQENKYKWNIWPEMKALNLLLVKVKVKIQVEVNLTVKLSGCSTLKQNKQT